MSKYTVSIQNRFAELGSDDESEVGEKRQQQQAPKKTATAAATTQQRKPVEGQRSSGPREPRRTRTSPSSGGAAPQPAATDGQDEVAEEARGGAHRVPRRPGGTSFRGRVAEIRKGQRQYDRHSGTGRGREMKKGGAGAHNWGREGPDFGSEEVPPTSEVVEAAATESGAEAGAPAAAAPAATTTTPPPPQVIDFSEYQRAQRMKRANLHTDEDTPQTEVRCVDAADLENAGFEKYEREETPEERAARGQLQRVGRDSEEEEEEEDVTGVGARPNRTYNLSEFTGGLNRPRRPRGGRGGRREGFESRVKTPEAERQQQQPVGVSLDLRDAAAFPSLA